MKKKMATIDPGHAPGDSNKGPTGYYEYAGMWKISNYLKTALIRCGMDAKLTRTEYENPSLEERGKRSKGSDVFISEHSNAFNGQVRGAECFHSLAILSDKIWAGKLATEISTLMKNNNRGAKTRESISTKGRDYYGVIRSAVSVGVPHVFLVENGFHDNATDEAFLKNESNLERIGETQAKVICEMLGVAYIDSTQAKEGQRTLIMGKTIATVAQMVSYALKGNPKPLLPSCTIEELAQIFIEEGKIEGVRSDVAWAQALKETGFFKYGNIVLPTQNNYAGIGALNDNKQGEAATFKTPREGVRAQIQHLKAYASTEPLKQVCVDPRFGLVKRGSAKYVEWLGAGDNPNKVGWCYPGHGYGSDIVKMMDVLGGTKVVETKEHWGQNAINELLEMKIINTSHDPNKTVTWAEFAAVITRIVKQNEEQYS